ncbi:MAG: hypothetical protein ACYCT7_03575 [bacterium]
MLSNEEKIKTAYKAGLKKSQIIEYYGLTKPRLDRILADVEKVKRQPQNNSLLGSDLKNLFYDYPKSLGLDKILSFAETLDLDVNELYQNRAVKSESINIINDVIYLLENGVKREVIAFLSIQKEDHGIDASGIFKILKRRGIKIKAASETEKIEMTDEQKEILKEIYGKNNIYPNFFNAVNIVRYALITFNLPFRNNDLIKVLVESTPEDDEIKESRFLKLGQAMWEFRSKISL